MVVLPLPLPPMIATTLPRGNRMLIPFRIGTDVVTEFDVFDFDQGVGGHREYW